MNDSAVIVFYADQVLLEFSSAGEFASWRQACCVGDREIYDGSYVWYRRSARWWRMDLTPVLIQDVPPALRAWVLIL